MTSCFVPVKLVKSELMALDELIVVMGAESRAAVLRAGLGLLFDQHGLIPSWEQEIERERRKHPPRGRNWWGRRSSIPVTLFKPKGKVQR